MKSQKLIDNKSIVRRYYEEVVNTGNIKILPSFISEEYTEVYNHQRVQCGMKGAEEHILSVRENYKNLTLTIERQIAEGEWVVTSYTMTGIHSGTWMGMKPTGKELTVTGVNVDKVVDGKIVEHSGAANMFEAFVQTGAVKIVGE